MIAVALRFDEFRSLERERFYWCSLHGGRLLREAGVVLRAGPAHETPTAGRHQPGTGFFNPRMGTYRDLAVLLLAPPAQIKCPQLAQLAVLLLFRWFS